jgi:hypothetical protein
MKVSSSQFSHREILKTFETLLVTHKIKTDSKILKAIEDFMAFRHVATKIYGFLLEWEKVQVITKEIEENHSQIKHLFLRVVDMVVSK